MQNNPQLLLIIILGITGILILSSDVIKTVFKETIWRNKLVLAFFFYQYHKDFSFDDYDSIFRLIKTYAFYIFLYLSEYLTTQVVF